MVSSAVGMSKAELQRTLARIKREHAADAEYRALRKEWPRSWPM
jgi:hypothetical protein